MSSRISIRHAYFAPFAHVIDTPPHQHNRSKPARTCCARQQLIRAHAPAPAREVPAQKRMQAAWPSTECFTVERGPPSRTIYVSTENSSVVWMCSAQTYFDTAAHIKPQCSKLETGTADDPAALVPLGKYAGLSECCLIGKERAKSHFHYVRSTPLADARSRTASKSRRTSA